MGLTENAKAYQAKVGEIEDFWKGVGDIDPSDFTNEQKQQIDRLNNEGKELGSRVQESQAYQAMRDEQQALKTALSQPVGRPEYGTTDPRQPAEESKGDSIGARFANNPELKAWMKQVAPTGNLPDATKVGMSPAYEVKTLLTGLSATSAGAMVRRDYAPLVDFPFQPLTLRDVVTVGRTGSDLIEFPRVTGYTNNAAVTAEATATSATSLGQSGIKPESAMALEKVTESVRTIAHWIPVTRRAISDAPQIETLVNNFLRVGLELALETGDDYGQRNRRAFSRTG
jgi:HK97 family phage major capsid protein